MTIAHTIKFTYGSTDVFDINSGSNVLMSYIPQSPDMTTMDSNNTLEDGGERTLTTRRNVTESLTFMATASSNTEIQSAKQNLQKLLNKAERRQESSAGSQVFLNLGPANISGSYRSEILGGRVDLTDRSFNGVYWGNRKVEFQVTFTRRFFWEGDETTISDLKNGHGTGASIQIYNHDDATHDNYAEISASSVSGEIPTPAKVMLINAAACSMWTTNFYVAHNILSSPGSLPHFLEGETGFGTIMSACISSSAIYSSGSALQVYCSSGGLTTQIKVARWTLAASSLLNYCLGGHFAILGRLKSSIGPNASIYGQMKIMFPFDTGLTKLSEGPEVELTTVTGFDNIYNFGVFRLPPNLSYTSGFTDLGMMFYARTSGSLYINFDYFQFTPVDTGFRKVSQIGYTWDSGQIAIDEPNDGIYSSASTSGEGSKFSIFTIAGKRISLYPGELQRLYFLNSEGNVTYVDRTMYAKVSYRPRRLTI